MPNEISLLILWSFAALAGFVCGWFSRSFQDRASDEEARLSGVEPAKKTGAARGGVDRGRVKGYTLRAPWNRRKLGG